MVRWAWGSRSMRQTFLPSSASVAPRLTVVVVFPTPPFWFIRAMVRMIAAAPWRTSDRSLIGLSRGSAGVQGGECLQEIQTTEGTEGHGDHGGGGNTRMENRR